MNQQGPSLPRAGLVSQESSSLPREKKGSAGREVAVQKGPRRPVIQPRTSAFSSVKWGVNRDPTGFLEHTCSVASAEPSSKGQALHKCSSPRFRQTLEARVLSWGQVKNKHMCPPLDNVPHLLS